MQGQVSGEAFFVVLFIGVTIGLIMYLFPTIIAMFRGHPNKGMIFLINVFTGGTGIGWFVCLFWAAGAVGEEHHYHHYDDDED